MPKQLLEYIITAKNEATKVLKKMQKDFNNVEKQTKILSKSLDQASVKFTILTAAMVGAGSLFVKLASDAEETQNKFDAVFGSMSDQAEMFANTLSESVGRNATDLKDGLAAFQGFAKGMGFAEDEAFIFSTKLQELSIDFASFNNLSDGESQQRFISAMSGSAEVMDKFGVNIKAGALDLELQAQGLAKNTAAANEKQKAIARLAIIMRTMTDQGAVGDAIKTSESFANQLKRLTSDMKTLGEEIGRELLPLALDLVKHGVVLIKVFKNLSPETKKLIVQVALGTTAFTALIAAAGLTKKAITALSLPLKIASSSFGILSGSSISTAKSFKLVTGASVGLKASLITMIPILGAAAAAAVILIGRFKELEGAQIRSRAAISANISGMEKQVNAQIKLANTTKGAIGDLSKLRAKQLLTEQSIQAALQKGDTETAKNLQITSNLQFVHIKNFTENHRAELDKQQQNLKDSTDTTEGEVDEMEELFKNLGGGLGDSISKGAGGGGKAVEKMSDKMKEDLEKIFDTIKDLNEKIKSTTTASTQETIKIQSSFTQSVRDSKDALKDLTEEYAANSEEMIKNIDSIKDKIAGLDEQQANLPETFSETFAREIIKQKQVIADLEKQVLDESIGDEKLTELKEQLEKEKKAFEDNAIFREENAEQIKKLEELFGKTEFEQNLIKIQADLEEEEKAIEAERERLQEELENQEKHFTDLQEKFLEHNEELQTQRLKDLDNYQSFLKLRENSFERHLLRLRNLESASLTEAAQIIEPGQTFDQGVAGEQRGGANNNEQNININLNFGGVNIKNGQDLSQFEETISNVISDTLRKSNLGIPE